MPKLAAVAGEHDLDQLTSLFRLLADKTRLNILMALARGERNVSSLCDELQLSQPTVSHHLGLLRASNVIANNRRGKQVFYALNSAVSAADDTSLELSAEHFGITIAHKLK
jgi:DNA-binding transcriptional ArsR family regulator